MRRRHQPHQGRRSGTTIVPVNDMLRRFRHALALLALLPAALWLMGLGGGTESNALNTIPIPRENFTVVIKDRSGQEVEAKRVTWEGKVYLRGQVGNATVSMPFEKVRSVKVLPPEGQTAGASVRAAVTLRSGDTVDLMIDRGSKCYGETKYGNYEIFFKDLAELTFQ